MPTGTGGLALIVVALVVMFIVYRLLEEQRATRLAASSPGSRIGGGLGTLVGGAIDLGMGGAN